MKTEVTAITLILASILQLSAAVIALKLIRETGRFRLAWVFISMALTLMVSRRLLPLWTFLQEAKPATFNVSIDALFSLLISLLILLGMLGIRKLFIALKHQQEQLQRIANTDILTGLANRRAIIQRLKLETDRSNRNHHPLSLLMFDIDYFKKINDTWGHAAGDSILSAIGEVCRNTRSIDLVGRWGGEEFVVILPDTNSENAAAVAERLRLIIADTIVTEGDTILKVTVSIGVTTSEFETKYEVLLAHADTALYDAKYLGRNQVVVWH